MLRVVHDASLARCDAWRGLPSLLATHFDSRAHFHRAQWHSERARSSDHAHEENYGLQVGHLELARGRALAAADGAPSHCRPFFASFAEEVSAKLEGAKRDNDTAYYERVPNASDLPTSPRPAQRQVEAKLPPELTPPDGRAAEALLSSPVAALFGSGGPAGEQRRRLSVS